MIFFFFNLQKLSSKILQLKFKKHLYIILVNVKTWKIQIFHVKTTVMGPGSQKSLLFVVSRIRPLEVTSRVPAAAST